MTGGAAKRVGKTAGHGLQPARNCQCRKKRQGIGARLPGKRVGCSERGAGALAAGARRSSLCVVEYRRRLCSGGGGGGAAGAAPRRSEAHAYLALLLLQAATARQRLPVWLLHRQRAGGASVHRPAGSPRGQQARLACQVAQPGRHNTPTAPAAPAPSASKQQARPRHTPLACV